jgi:hypothetical protein
MGARNERFLPGEPPAGGGFREDGLGAELDNWQKLVLPEWLDMR